VLDGFRAGRKLHLIHAESVDAECGTDALVVRACCRVRAWSRLA
jgi:hypothetical protein